MAERFDSRTIGSVLKRRTNRKQGDGNHMMLFEMVEWLQARLNTDERGAAAVEYGMLVALIAAVIIITVGLLGGQVNTAFNKIVGKF